MSKMPAKKKSCFQITSVTQAQVAASSITDDTESLDDPDESRTEDVSSEIFDVSRADFEPEACDISSSEETLNNVGETDVPGTVAPHIPQDGQLPTVSGPPNGGFAFRSIGVAGVAHVNQQVLGTPTTSGQLPAPAAGAAQQSVPVAAGGAAPTPPASSVSSTTTSTTSCSSRFRVIKLDHGTGEPFRRGRWTCTEFYERDSEGSVITRTVDSIRHASTLDHSMDRDSGLGATGGSLAPTTLSGPGPEPMNADSAVVTAPHPHTVETNAQQSYSAGHQPPSSALQPPGYSPAPVPNNIATAPGIVQPGAPGTNGVHQSLSLQHVQKSPSMPTASQAQQFAYPPQQQQQLLPGHQLAGHPSLAPPGQPDYRQQTLPVGISVSQGPSPVMTPATGVAPGLGTPGQAGELVGPAGPQGLLQQQQAGGGQYQPNHGPSSAVQSPLGPAQGPRSGSLGLQGSPAGSAQAEDGRRKSDAPAQPLAAPGKDLVRPLIPEGLTLATPAVNSLFAISIIDGDEDGASGASVVAIDNKIEQAMDLVKSHLMYAVREEVEVLKEQIKELYERNSVLERENAVLKSLANNEQLSQLAVQPGKGLAATPPQPVTQQQQQQQQPEVPPPQPNVSSA
ncbi:hypothetical protein AGOR_G00242820 [Albula goreensis]|uniref:TSC22 domain family protein 2 n=1 Tax=Albula goreensis TaxID=1534307 RepID=A0A8T3CF09_9TELE|nr:hypothetical protein AGOR_G00242820 [Albula goreensis]